MVTEVKLIDVRINLSRSTHVSRETKFLNVYICIYYLRKFQYYDRNIKKHIICLIIVGLFKLIGIGAIMFNVVQKKTILAYEKKKHFFSTVIYGKEPFKD